MRCASVILGDDHVTTAVAIPLSKDRIQRHDYGILSRQLQGIALIPVAKFKSDSALWLGIIDLEKTDNRVTTSGSAVARGARVHHFVVSSRRVELLRLHASPQRLAARDLVKDVGFVLDAIAQVNRRVLDEPFQRSACLRSKFVPHRRAKNAVVAENGREV